MNTPISKMLGIDYPIIMAPMFLVSNAEMVIAAGNSGITGCIPALNYRTIEELEAGIKQMKAGTKGPIGINIIVNKSNVNYKKQLHKCLDLGVDYFITSLGSPAEVIKESKKNGVKVFCDVIEEGYARKVADLGADAVIAVNSGAGGHLGNIPATVLVPTLKEKVSIPVISAGGVGNGQGLFATFALGADGISIGSPFIASSEAQVNESYKKACIDYGAKDIAVTDKLSGSRCTVIKTPYLEKIGLNQNPVEKFLNSNKKIKKYAKMITYYKGMKLLEKAAFSASYKSVWCAGSSIEFSKEVRPVETIIKTMLAEWKSAEQTYQKRRGSHE